MQLIVEALSRPISYDFRSGEFIGMCVCVCVCVHTSLCAHVCMHMFVYVCVHCVYVCVCVRVIISVSSMVGDGCYPFKLHCDPMPVWDFSNQAYRPVNQAYMPKPYKCD